MSIHSADTNKIPGLTSGTMFVIATVVGGGMFSLPIAMQPASGFRCHRYYFDFSCNYDVTDRSGC